MSRQQLRVEADCAPVSESCDNEEDRNEVASVRGRGETGAMARGSRRTRRTGGARGGGKERLGPDGGR